MPKTQLKVVSQFQPRGDQPEAIKKLSKGLEKNINSKRF